MFGFSKTLILFYYIFINDILFHNEILNFVVAVGDVDTQIPDNAANLPPSGTGGKSVSQDDNDSEGNDDSAIYEPYEADDESENGEDVINIENESTKTQAPSTAVNKPPIPGKPTIPPSSDTAANFPVSEIVRQAYLDAVNLATKYWHMELLPIHLATVIFWNPQSIGGIWLSAAGGDHQKLANIFNEKLKSVPVASVQTNLKLSEQFAAYRNKVKDLSISYGMQVIKYDHIVEGFMYDQEIWYCLSFAGVTKESLMEVLNAARMSPEEKKLHAPLRLPTLSTFAKNLTDQVRSGEAMPCIARHDELTRIIETLMRRKKQSIMLKGEPKVGKTSIVYGLATRIVAGDIPKSLRNHVVMKLELNALFAARKHQTELDNNMAAIIKEIVQSGNRVILYLDEFQSLITGERSQIGGAEVLTHLKEGQMLGVKIIVETTNKDFTQINSGFPQLVQRFVLLPIEPPCEEDILLMCRAERAALTLFYEVDIPDVCFRFTYKLSRTFPNGAEPSSTLEFLDQALAHVKTQNENRPAIIDDLERKVGDLKLQLSSLSDATDLITQSKVKKMHQQLKQYEEDLIPLKEQHGAELIRFQKIKESKNKLAKLQIRAENLRFDPDQTERVEILYKVIPEVEAELAAATADFKAFRENYKHHLIKDELSIQDIAEIVAAQNHLSADQLTATTDGNAEYCMEMFDRNVVGFGPEKKHVCDRFSMRKAGILQNNKPITSMLLVGPTGVGKTWFAKEVASKIAVGESLCKLDMSEFSSRETVSSLMGAAPGLVGHEDNSYLVECVRAHPACVVLLDEMEKAHKEVLTHFLQIMDVGQMKDNKGNTVDFTNTILIWTSNIGADHYAAVGDENDPDYSNRVMQAKLNIRRELRTRLAPEFLQRMQLIKIIEPLKKKESKLIFKHKLKEMAKHLYNLMLIEVKMTDEAVDIVIDHVFDPLNGARIFQRWIDDNVLSIIAKQINSGIILPNCRVIIRKAKAGQESLVLTIIPRDDNGKPIPGADKSYKMPPAKNMIS